MTRAPGPSAGLDRLSSAIIACGACPRLVDWRERVARERVSRFSDQAYWGRPVPGFGDPSARILIVGLAPAAHGANRTGRMFTGDRSGDFLIESLYRCGLASQSASISADDGLRLMRVYLTAVNRCAPPGNKPTPQERDHCLPFLARELELLPAVQTIVCLGAWAWDGVLRALAPAAGRPRPRFGHASEAKSGRYRLLGCYHPSQQNTFTGRLTPAMIDAVFVRATELSG